MRRCQVLVLVGVAVLSLVGCSKGDDGNDAAIPTTLPGGTLPGTSLAPGTTRHVSTTTMSPSSTRASTTSTARPTSSTTASTTKPTSTTSSSTTAPTKASCGQIAGGGPGGDVASGITAAGVPCSDALALVAAVKAGHNFVSGPRSFTMNGFNCSVVTDNTGLPVGHYSCTSGTKTITWDKT